MMDGVVQFFYAVNYQLSILSYPTIGPCGKYRGVLTYFVERVLCILSIVREFKFGTELHFTLNFMS